MDPRDSGATDRVASPLELFFDLVFVVAVSVASESLHALETGPDPGGGVVAYLLVFFAIWWAWMNFTWFASAFATDDWLYRVTTIVQMGGALILAAGAQRAMADMDFEIVVKGYVLMRAAMVAQWLRAALSAPEYRRVALYQAAGIAAVQVAWVSRMELGPQRWSVPLFLALAAAEASIPFLAQLRVHIPWHPHHIAERYSLFTLIVLGESILASTNALIDATHGAGRLGPLLAIAACGLVLAAGMWWIYFSREQHRHLEGMRSSFVFGYFHYAIFAAAGAFSSGIEVMIDVADGTSALSPAAGAAAVTVPVALFILGIWGLTIRQTLGPGANAALAAGAVAVGLSPWARAGLYPAAAGVAGIVLVVEVSDARRRRAGAGPMAGG
ncbi:MAG: low temperature requirement protein A [Bifidobacteriaceae bacterium]|jgi:low temperature requirement protein LtrA|nr:low temperature requirement protein A [Bifidobacteriaceae bacterium]